MRPSRRRGPAARPGARWLAAALALAATAGCSSPTSAPATVDRVEPHTGAPPTSASGRPSDPGRPSSPVRPSDRVEPPPYVAGVRWVTTSSGRSLQVRPTAAGRTTTALYPEAWAEVLRLAPGADTPGMRAQFSCHWTFARALSPDKPSWNLEPWRPVVSPTDMLSAGCNPGGGRE